MTIHAGTTLSDLCRLRGALNDASRREEAAEIVRGLIDAIVLRPSGTGRGRTLSIDLSGHLARILNLAREAKRGAAGAPVSDQLKLVAGARNRHYLLFNAIGLCVQPTTRLGTWGGEFKSVRSDQ
jgi:hypothetical protein